MPSKDCRICARQKIIPADRIDFGWAETTEFSRSRCIMFETSEIKGIPRREVMLQQLATSGERTRIRETFWLMQRSTSYGTMNWCSSYNFVDKMDPEDIFKRFFSSPFPEFGPRGFGLVQSCLVKIKYVAASPDPDVRHLVQRWRTTQRRRAGCWRAAAVDLKLFSDRACDCQDGLSNGNTITKKTNRTLPWACFKRNAYLGVGLVWLINRHESTDCVQKPAAKQHQKQQ